MKTLYLVRHAKSSWDDPELIDHQRPLSHRGIRDAPFIGKILGQRRAFPDIILSSPAVRSQLTAEAIAGQLGYPRARIQYTMALYFQSISPIIRTIHALPTNADKAVLIGHNPDLTELQNILSPTHLDNIPTTGAVALTFQTDHWSGVEPKAGTRLFFEYPRLYFPKKD